MNGKPRPSMISAMGLMRSCGGRGLRRLLRQNLLTWLVLRRLSRLRRRHGLPDERSYADERRRDQGCGDQEKGKEAMAARPRCGRRRLGEAARQTFPLLKIIFPWHWIQRLGLDRVARFTA